jgi:hypothetical protein
MEKPVTAAKIAVKPHGVVQAGYLHIALPEAEPVTLPGGPKQAEV